MPPRHRPPPRARGRGQGRGPAQGGGRGGNAGGGNNQGGGANVQPPPPPVYSVDVSMIVQPISDASPVAIEAQHALALRTPFLPWAHFPVVGPAPARCSLATFQMAKAFGARCRISSSAPARQAAERVNLLTFRLSADAWSRILSCYVDSGLLAESFSDLSSLSTALTRLQLLNEHDLEIEAADWEPGERFALPQNAPPQHALAPLSYLESATVALLQNDAEPNQPWGLLCDLVGALGPCLTQAARARPTSSVQLVAQRLRAHVGGASVSDGAAALGLKDALPDLKLPVVLQSQSLREADLRAELLDAVGYYFSSAQGRAAIEARRVVFLGAR